MSIAPIPDFTAASNLPLAVVPAGQTKRHLAAAFLSALVPGTGQLFLGQRRKGITLLILFAVLLFGFWPLRLLRSYAGFVGLYCSWTFLYIYSACSAQLARYLPKMQRPSRWWLAATLPAAMVTLSLLGRAVTRLSGFRSFIIPSTSMEQTLRRGDRFVMDSTLRKPKRRDVVVLFKDHLFLVKRVIAVAGDSVESRDGVVFVNSKRQDEPYAGHTGLPYVWMNNFGPITIPAGKYFVMGDNRDVSLDSRSADFGLVDQSSIVGEPLYIFASDRVGKNIK
jgi:signal peptidase I